MDVNDFNKEEEEDVFADDPDVQESRREQAEREENIKRSVATVAQEFSLVEIEEGDISAFDTILEGIRINIADVRCLTAENNSGEMMVLLQYLKIPGKRSDSNPEGENCFFSGLLRLRNEFPLTHVYKENLSIKVADWFIKADVDFKEQKKFSAKFHVVTKDKDKLTRLLQNKPLDELVQFPDLHLELSGYNLTYCLSPENAIEDDTVRFIQLTKLLKRIFV
jgi:hypothetical protein